MSKAELWLGVKYSEMNKQQKKIYWNMCKKESRKRHPESIKESNRKYREKQKQKNSNLEAKLAESEADKKALICDYESRITKEQELMSWLEHNNEELKQQLAEKDNKIQMLNAMIATLPEHDKELKEICNQDKISFCIEKLEKVKNRIESTVESIYKRLDDLNIKIVCESTSRQLNTYEEIVKEIDNQREQLKKEMK